MKKDNIVKAVIGVLAVIAGVLTLGYTAFAYLPTQSHSVAIIGGADGPTSIFLAGKTTTGSPVLGIVIGVVLLVVGTTLIILKNKRVNGDGSF